MNFDFEEREIKKALESYRLKKPPDSLMKNYEEAVWKKIRASEKSPAFGITLGLSIAVVLAFLFVLVFILQPKPAKAPARTPVPPLTAPLTAPQPARVIQEEVDFDQMAEELFILEALGEDEGLLDDLERLTTDIEFWAPAGSAL
jgi:hypothetical protein